MNKIHTAPWSSIIREALAASLLKLDPRVQLRNPVMFCVYVGSMMTAIIALQCLFGCTAEPTSFVCGITIWLWFTVLFANFAEAIAEGQGKAQADSLRRSRTTVSAFRLDVIPDSLTAQGASQDADGASRTAIVRELKTTETAASHLALNDLLLVQAGQFIPTDGEVIVGVATVDESAVTGESAPVVRESGGDRNAVTGGTRVLSDWLIIRVTALPGQSFLDRMISMVEGARRQKTPNELALAILLAALTLIFLLVTAVLLPYSSYGAEISGRGSAISLTVLIALFVCLAPTTIGALLSAVGIAGINRLSRSNVVAMSGRAVEAAGDVDVLLLDKTGTITLGNRQAAKFVPAPGRSEQELAEAAHLASLADETAEGRSIAVLAKHRFGLRGIELNGEDAEFVPFSARTRMSGVNIGGHEIRKGAADTVEKLVVARGRVFPIEIKTAVETIAKSGGTPLVVCRDAQSNGRDRAQRHSERWNQGTLCRTAQDGDQDRHDHR
ncbi:MAG: potassium-transporting ATPase subunit KdpB [Pirellulales bacterium]